MKSAMDPISQEKLDRTQDSVSLPTGAASLIEPL